MLCRFIHLTTWADFLLYILYTSEKKQLMCFCTNTTTVTAAVCRAPTQHIYGSAFHYFTLCSCKLWIISRPLTLCTLQHSTQVINCGLQHKIRFAEMESKSKWTYGCSSGGQDTHQLHHGKFIGFLNTDCCCFWIYFMSVDFAWAVNSQTAREAATAALRQRETAYE